MARHGGFRDGMPPWLKTQVHGTLLASEQLLTAEQFSVLPSIDCTQRHCNAVACLLVLPVFSACCIMHHGYNCVCLVVSVHLGRGCCTHLAGHRCRRPCLPFSL